MRILIHGETKPIRAVALNDARGRDVAALQHQTGWTLDEIHSKTSDPTAQVEFLKMVEFLSEHNRGRFLSWDEVLDRPLAAMLVDPGDVRDAPAQGEAEDPTSATTVSQSGAAVAARKRKGKGKGGKKNHGSRPSGAKSPGSTTRSTPASSTS